MATNNIVGQRPPCEFDLPVIYLTALIVRSFRVLFSAQRDQLIPALRHLQWAPGATSDGKPSETGAPESRTLVIEDMDAFDPGSIGAKPAIYVRANDWALVKLGLAGNQHIGEGFSDITGQEIYTKNTVGSLSIFCLSRIPMECRMLSYSAAVSLQHFAKPIRKGTKLNAFEVSGVKAPKPLREKPDHLAGIVTVDYGSYMTWNLEPLAPKLTDIQFQTAGTGLRE